MAFQAEERLGLWREVEYVQKLCGIALFLFCIVLFRVIFKTFNGKATGAMAGFAVYQR